MEVKYIKKTWTLKNKCFLPCRGAVHVKSHSMRWKFKDSFQQINSKRIQVKSHEKSLGCLSLAYSFKRVLGTSIKKAVLWFLCLLDLINGLSGKVQLICMLVLFLRPSIKRGFWRMFALAIGIAIFNLKCAFVNIFYVLQLLLVVPFGDFSLFLPLLYHYFILHLCVCINEMKLFSGKLNLIFTSWYDNKCWFRWFSFSLISSNFEESNK